MSKKKRSQEKNERSNKQYSKVKIISATEAPSGCVKAAVPRTAPWPRGAKCSGWKAGGFSAEWKVRPEESADTQ